MGSKKIIKAFTLVEVLVVLAIIGLIMAFATLSYSSIREKGRNLKRLKDIEQIQTALKLYFYNESLYPDSINFGLALKGSSSSSTYMTLLPHNPKPENDGVCPDSDYSYQTTNSGNGYRIDFCLSKAVGNFSAGAKCATASGILNYGCDAFVCGQDFTDPRDSQVYGTVAIDTQCWMSESMNVGTRVDATLGSPCTLAIVPSIGGSYGWLCQQNDGAIEKYCYNNDDNECLVYGGLYEWTEAMQLPVNCANVAVDCSSLPDDPCCNYATPRQGICPTGWHIPSVAEYSILLNSLGGQSVAGNELKEVGFDHWDTNNINSTNSSGFTSLAAGRWGYDGFNNIKGSSNGAYNMLWTADTSGELSGRIAIRSSDGYVNSSNPALRDRGFAVRCIQD